MQIDDFLTLLKTRRSIRSGFKPDPIPDEFINKILEAGRWAMSGGNGQPWELIVIKNQKTKDEMARTWAEVKPESDAIELTRLAEYRHPLPVSPAEHPFKTAPVLIVVCGDRRTFQATVLSSGYLTGEGQLGATYIKNVANCTQNMHLAAATLGIGSQWVSVTRPWEVALRDILRVPAVIEIHSVVALGYPVSVPPPSCRRELKEFVHYEKFEMSKFRVGADVLRWLRESRWSIKSGEKPAKK